jgi:hypothetical protein
MPGGLLATGAAQNVVATDSGLPWCCGSDNAWLVTFDLQSPFNAAAGTTYWLGLTGAGGTALHAYWLTATYTYPGNGGADYGDGFFSTSAEYAFYLESDPVITPLPAALPLLASGLGAMGLLGWRRKKKATALAA